MVRFLVLLEPRQLDALRSLAYQETGRRQARVGVSTLVREAVDRLLADGGPPAPPRRKRKAPVRRFDQSADWLRREYLEKKRSTADIGRELGVGHGVVWAALLRAGIPVRSRSDAQKVALASGRHPSPAAAKARKRGKTVHERQASLQQLFADLGL